MVLAGESKDKIRDTFEANFHTRTLEQCIDLYEETMISIPSQVVRYICHPSFSWIALSMITFGNECLKANYVRSRAQVQEINRQKQSSGMGYVPLCS